MQVHGGSGQGHAERRSYSRGDILPIPEGNEAGSQTEQLDGADSNECGWYVLFLNILSQPVDKLYRTMQRLL